MIEGFKKFIVRGNVVDLAVGVIIGAAFGAIVKSMVEDVITPVLGLAGGTPDFSALKLGPIKIGNFINALVNFLIQALVVYFAIVVPIGKLMERLKKEDEIPADEPSDEVKLLTEIRDLLKEEKK